MLQVSTIMVYYCAAQWEHLGALVHLVTLSVQVLEVDLVRAEQLRALGDAIDCLVSASFPWGPRF